MKSTPLFSCLYGSALFGTRTPTSDRDEKTIVLPALEDLLLGKQVKNKVKNTNKEKNVRNSADDVDQEFIPLQIFAQDFMAGQTYALELAFAVEGNHAEQKLLGMGTTTYIENGKPHRPMFVAFVQELREKFLTSNIKAMMGYVVNQASLYSFKGERLNAVKDFELALHRLLGMFQTDQHLYRLSECRELERFNELIEVLKVKHAKYFREELYDIGNGEMRPSFKLLEKTFPFTSTVEHTLGVVTKLREKYGSRAEQASETNVDWKATMHALRIVDEGLLLLREHRLEFPFSPSYVARLLAIKRGEEPLDPLREELSDKLSLLKDLEKLTTLPAQTPEMDVEFEAWLLGWLKMFYQEDMWQWS